MAVGTFYLPNTSAGGSIAATPGPTWSTLRGATTGSLSTNVFGMTISIDGSTYYLNRFFFPFNTTSLPTGSVINSAYISLYRDDTVRFYLNTQVSTLHIIPSTQTDPTSLAAADFDNVTFTSKGSLALASAAPNNTYFNITLSDLTLIIPGGYTKLALTNERDLNNNAPTGECFIGIQNSAAANPPKLVIDYTPPPSGGSPIFFGNTAIV